jgi:hypothetical protein
MIDVMIKDDRYDRCDGKLGYVTATATLTLGTGIVTTAIAFSAEERLKLTVAKKTGIASFFQI